MATASSDSLQARKPGRGGSGRRLRTDKEARKPLTRFHDARSVCGLRGGALATHGARLGCTRTSDHACVGAREHSQQ